MVINVLGHFSSDSKIQEERRDQQADATYLELEDRGTEQRKRKERSQRREKTFQTSKVIIKTHVFSSG